MLLVTTIELALSITLVVNIPLFWSFFLGFYGGYPVLQHLILRLLLQRNDLIPVNLAKFLDFTSSLILTRKVGGGYIFVHRYLLEYFAELKTVDPTDVSTD